MARRGLIVIAAVLLMARCAFGEEERFIFGISAPLSGVLAEYGAAVQNGVALAREDASQQFKGIEVAYEDSQWDAKTALAAFHTLRTRKGAKLIYNWGNPTSEAVGPVAERLKYPLLAMSSDPKISRGGRYVIRSIRSGLELGEMLGEHLVSRGLRKIAVVVCENSYVRTLVEGVSGVVNKSGGAIDVIGSYSVGDQDFRSAISRLRSKAYDAIGVMLITGQVQTFFKQLQAQGVALPTFGGDFFGSRTEIAASGPGINGAVFPDLRVSPAFRARYKERFGNDIQIAFAANAYDIAMLVAREFSVAGSRSLSSDQIIARIKASKPLMGAHGTMAFEESQDFGPALVSGGIVRKVENGDIIDLQ